jgi:hypothetical protein
VDSHLHQNDSFSARPFPISSNNVKATAATSAATASKQQQNNACTKQEEHNLHVFCAIASSAKYLYHFGVRISGSRSSISGRTRQWRRCASRLRRLGIGGTP